MVNTSDLDKSYLFHQDREQAKNRHSSRTLELGKRAAK